jgi:iron complex outermembrane receptor protein
MLAVPSSTATLAAEWEGGPWLASLTAARARDWTNYDRLELARDFVAGTRNPSEPIGVGLRRSWREYDGSTDLRATVSRQLGSRVWITAAGDNLLGGQLNEPDNATIRPGRTLTLGVRARF